MAKKLLTRSTTVLVILGIVLVSTTFGFEENPSSHGDFLAPTKKSIAQFQARVSKNPHDFRSAIVLARLHMRNAREQDHFDSYVDAENVLRSALQFSPTENSIRSFLAETLMAQHRFTAAKKLAEKVIAEVPGSWMALSTLGDANMQLGNYQAAEKHYQKLTTRCNSAAATIRLSRYLEVTGNIEQAIHLAKSALQNQQALHSLKSTEGWFHWRLGSLYLANGEHAAAKPYFESALDLNPRDSESLADLGKIAFIEGDTALAIRNLKKAIDLAEKPPYLILLGHIHHANHQLPEAKSVCEQARKLLHEEAKHPVAGPAHARERARFLLQQNEQTELALRLAKQDFKTRPDLFAHDLLAWAYYKNGRIADAKKAIEQALAVNNRNAEILFHAGMIAAEIGEPRVAAERLSKALKLNAHFSIPGAAIAKMKLNELSREFQ